MKLRSIKDAGDIRGKKILLRLDLNVPVQDGVITDDFRIRKSMPTIEWLRNAGAKIIIISHCEGKELTSLKIPFEYLKRTLPISFVEKYVDDATVSAVSALAEGEMLLLENLRQYPGEKENDPEFARLLASLADIYVNEAFSVSHRKHASVVGIPSIIPSYAGLLFENEVENLSKTFNPPHPFLFILGGAKFDTKIPLITKFLEIADTVFVGGALANNFFKEMGYNVGASVVSDGNFELKKLLENKKIILPIDVVVKRGETIEVKLPTNVTDDDMILDAGPSALGALGEIVDSSKYVLWNGPLGNFEIGFKGGTLELAKKIAESTAESVIGGADTLSAIAELHIEDKFSFVSSGGGAMLDFLANGTLPGIEVLKK